MELRHRMNGFIQQRRKQVFESFEVGHILSGNVSMDVEDSDSDSEDEDDDDQMADPSFVNAWESEEDSPLPSSSEDEDESERQSTADGCQRTEKREIKPEDVKTEDVKTEDSEPEIDAVARGSTRSTGRVPQPATRRPEPESDGDTETGATPCKRCRGSTQTRSRAQPAPPCGSEPPWLADDVEDAGPETVFRFNPSQEVGPQMDRTASHKPGELFSLFFSQSTLRTLCENTNKYAVERKTKGKKYKWVDLDVPELKKFIGLLIYMAFVELPSVQDYWKKKHICSVPYPSQIMARDRFRVIMWNIHMSDPEEEKVNDEKKGTPEYDKLFRVKPLLGQILTACRAHYGPDKELSIDESIVPTKGKNGFTQYNKDKPNKYGMKLFVLAEAKSGYTLYFNIYTGKAQTHTVRGLSYDAVMNLLGPSNLGTGHHIYMDNFYTSPTLLRDLFKKKYGACGTYRDGKKGCPKARENGLPKNAPKGAMRWIREAPLLFVKWMDTREVRMCSTIHSATYDGVIKRKWKTEAGLLATIDVPCPAPVKAYNKYMGGVDLSDQLSQYYSTHRKVAQWSRTLFLHFLDIATTNAFILHKELAKGRTDPPLEHKQFMVGIVSELCGVDVSGLPAKKSYDHLPVLICAEVQDDRLKASKGRKKCVQCKARMDAEWHKKVQEGKVEKNEKPQRVSDTPWMCMSCEIPLCIIPGRNCFREFHMIWK